MIDCANILTNTECNNSCIWCYAMSTLQSGQSMSEDTFRTVLSRLGAVGCKSIVFTGGEPTLHPLLPVFIRKALLTKGIEQVHIVSNGSGFTDKFLDSISTYRDAVGLNLSLHGATAHVHDLITRTPGSYDRLLSAIERAQRKGFAVAAQMTLCKANRSDLSGVLHLLEAFEIDRILVNFCSKPVNVEFRAADFLTVREFSEQVARDVCSYAGNTHIHIGPPLPRCELSASFKELLDRGKIRLNAGCGIISDKLIVDPQGNLLLCSHLPGVTIGNIGTSEDFPRSLAALDNKFKRPFRKYPLDKCHRCEERQECVMGGCPLLWLKFRT